MLVDRIRHVEKNRHTLCTAFLYSTIPAHILLKVLWLRRYFACRADGLMFNKAPSLKRHHSTLMSASPSFPQRFFCRVSFFFFRSTGDRGRGVCRCRGVTFTNGKGNFTRDLRRRRRRTRRRSGKDARHTFSLSRRRRRREMGDFTRGGRGEKAAMAAMAEEEKKRAAHEDEGGK